MKGGNYILNESNYIEWDIGITDYVIKLTKFLQIRMDNIDIKSSIDIRIKKKNREEYIESVRVKVEDKKFKKPENNFYIVNLSEVVSGNGDSSITTKKYSYEIKNEYSSLDYFRFDFKPSKEFPNYHINADHREWGKYHLTYPDDTDIDLEKLDIFKALHIFQKYVANPDSHPLSNENVKYKDIIKS